MSGVAVLGEALVDVLPGDDGEPVRVPGGSPANVAIAMARLGLPVTFLGGLSDDADGVLLRDHFDRHGVVVHGRALLAPTATATVTIDGRGAATYAFSWDGTADLQVTLSDLPDPLEHDAVVVGSVNAVLEPVATTVRDLVVREHERTVVVLDPNIRDTVITDADATRDRLLELASFATIVKASDEDLAFLLPHLDPDEAAFALLDGEATRLVAVTRGADGAWITTPRYQLPVAAVAVEVADTVGAGDTFTAGLVAALSDHGHLSRRRLRSIDAAVAKAVGTFAAAAAGVVVGRHGADAPTRAELPGNA